MPTPPPLPPAARTPFGPEGEPKTVQDVSHRVRDAAGRHERRRGPAKGWPEVDVANPLLRLAGAALFGFALGTIVHARPAPEKPPTTPRRPRPAPVAAYRPPRPGEERRTSIRFR